MPCFKSGAFHSVQLCQSPHHWPVLPANQNHSYLRAGGTSLVTCRYPTNGRSCLLCPETRGTQLHRERNRCSEIRAAIQPGRKPQSHCFHRLNQPATAQPQMEILQDFTLTTWFISDFDFKWASHLALHLPSLCFVIL